MSALRKAVALVSLALLGSVLAHAPASAAGAHRTVNATLADEAPSYNINPAHSGSTTLSTGFSTPMKQIWSVDLGAQLSYAVIGDGAVFTMGDNNTLTALEMTTGKTRWSKTIAQGTLFKLLGPAYDNGMVFVSNTANLLSAFAASNGKTKWATQMPLLPYTQASPMAVNGQVYTTGTDGDGIIYAVDETSGIVLWQRYVSDGYFSIPAFGDNGVYVSYPCQFYKFDPATGATDWQNNGGLSGAGGRTAVYSSKQVYAQDESLCGDVIAASHSGKVTGSFDQGFMDSEGNPTVFISKQGKNMGLSVTSNPQTLVCWDGKTGRKKWSFTGDGGLSANAIVVNGTIVAGSSSGQLFFLNQKGKQIWQTRGGYNITNLAAGEGTLIAVSESLVTAFVPQ